MAESAWLTGLIFLVLAVFAYAWYVSLVGRRNQALEALSGIDVQLRKRFDLIPNVLKIAARFMEHEKSLLSQITELRGQAQQSYDQRDSSAVAAHLKAATAVQPALAKLFAVAENYPELKSDQTMIAAQHSYEEVEGHIAAARRAYNAAVTSLNNSVQIFPGSLVASMAGISSMPYFREADTAVREPVDANVHLA